MRGQERWGDRRRGQERRGEVKRGQDRSQEEKWGEERRGQEIRGEDRTGEETRGNNMRGEERRGQETRGEDRRQEERSWDKRRGEETRKRRGRRHSNIYLIVKWKTQCNVHFESVRRDDRWKKIEYSSQIIKLDGTINHYIDTMQTWHHISTNHKKKHISHLKCLPSMCFSLSVVTAA